MSVSLDIDEIFICRYAVITNKLLTGLTIDNNNDNEKYNYGQKAMPGTLSSSFDNARKTNIMYTP